MRTYHEGLQTPNSSCRSASRGSSSAPLAEWSDVIRRPGFVKTIWKGRSPSGWSPSSVWVVWGWPTKVVRVVICTCPTRRSGRSGSPSMATSRLPETVKAIVTRCATTWSSFHRPWLGFLAGVIGQGGGVERFVEAEEIDPSLQRPTTWCSRAPGQGLPPSARGPWPTTARCPVQGRVPRGKHLATLRLRDNVFVLETMFWPDEIRTPKCRRPGPVGRAGPRRSHGQEPHRQPHGRLQAKEFHDEYRAALRGTIQKKIQGEVTPIPKRPSRLRWST